ncbi:two-component system sensor histidine kinase NtrB [Archangium violaceum]|uniref:histidine kinase n=1 Tax=Archangium violaceum Cb vi76 TaxID=1406225 RepID=A0A084T201_9BACT|nr:HAMP domain-containing sensor histidine kinase [Archangium violaceum]KFA94736.1 histidine kinase [Archangium violaceum Cb vi76]
MARLASRALGPLGLATLGLVGALAATLALYRAGSAALEQALDARLRGAGESAALLLTDAPASPERLEALMKANALDGVYVVDRKLAVPADATGPARRRVDLLRTDPAGVEAALAGGTRVGPGYAMGELQVTVGYFPVRGSGGQVESVLVLEAGRAFSSARDSLRRALWGGVALSAVGALALALVAARWLRDERARREAAAKAARGEVLTKMAAMAAHEIRNPLGVIRGTVELMRERSGAKLSERDRESLEDVLGEVERLRRLTEDLLDLSADRPLAAQRVELSEVLEEAARATEAAFPGVKVRRSFAELPLVEGDAGRLRQVFANLLQNAAQAQGEGEVRLAAEPDGSAVRVRVEDDGPGVPPEVRQRLFDLFVTGKANGTGLGLALCRRLVERHGGTVTLVPEQRQGSTFEVRLPAASQAR